MEELENLRADSEALEKEIVAPAMFNVLKVLVKFGVVGICVVGLTIGNYCGDEMKDLVFGTCLSVFVEAGLLSGFLMVKYNSEKCVKCASYLLIGQMVFNVLFDIFYVGWGIYITIIYFNINECEHDFSFTDIVGLVAVIYFLLVLSIMLCCCGGKLCICLSTLMASAKTGIDRSLSHDLVNVRRESFVAE